MLLVAIGAGCVASAGGALPAVAQGLHVYIETPTPQQPVFGPVEVRADVSAAAPVERVVFYLDDIVVGEVAGPPYELVIDAGQENREHVFAVVAYDDRGRTASDRVTTPRLRMDETIAVTLQQLYVSVEGARGRRILDLGRDDFEIFDEGARQELVTFARGDIPFTAVVLVDSSHSMRGEKLRAALAGARAFFEGMLPLDEGCLLVFSDRIRHATPFTSFAEILTSGLGRVEAGGGTALYDHLYVALKELEVRQGRRVVLVLSDGVDGHSVLSLAQDVVPKVRRSQALLYWLRMPARGGSGGGAGLSARTSSWRSAEEYREAYGLLERTVAESGGRVLPVSSSAAIEPTFRSIMRELRQQYALGYYPSTANFDGSWRRVRVRVKRPGMEVRARGGYLDTAR